MANLPSRFPCWCRAVYSWGGETDRDLGFIEGDLIECLNAGDGSWWMGRLHRDKRMMGLFPSNFVTVLADDFVPMRRSISPMPNLQKTDSTNSVTQDKKEKAKSRKPFGGYKNAKSPMATGTAAQAPASTPVSARAPQAYDLANPPSTVLWQQRPPSRAPSRSLLLQLLLRIASLAVELLRLLLHPSLWTTAIRDFLELPRPRLHPITGTLRQ
jgi:hypothetical protein